MSGIKLLGVGSQYYEMSIHLSNSLKQKDLELDAVSFSGALRHNYNPNMVLLLEDPLSPKSVIYEFRQEDIIFAEELPSQNREDGITVEMAKLWLKKGCIAMKMEPIRVGEKE